MILLQAHNISKSFGVTPILSNIQLEIRKGERVGLVGVNGAGKSTLIKILIGEMSFNEGEIMKAKDATIGYLSQTSGLESELSIWDEMKRVFREVIEQEKELRDLEQKLSDPQVIEQTTVYEKIMADYARISEAFKLNDGYQYEALIRNVLHGFGFSDKNYNDPVSSLSGGQKTRLALAKLLLQKPDVLILDEPTNYLDLETMAWLEQHLQSYQGGILIVSHDRYFLNALVNVIYEIERHKATKYHGNYDHFLEQKAANYEQQMKMFRKQQKEINQMEDFVQRNLARASTTKRAQSRRKALERMERMDQPDGDLKRTSFSFDIDRQSGNDVLKVEELAIGYEGYAPLSQNISFQAFREDSIAIVGPNGIGKSTLLKTILGQQKALAGTMQKGTNVSVAFYEQEQQQLNPSKSVLQEIWDDYPHMLERDVRGLLGQFLFTGEDVNKIVRELSGGEKARLALARLMLIKANLLVLDEPTNHLDIYSKEVLEQSLVNYPGTILFVSHDRYFLNRIATKVLELNPTGVKLYLGDYNYYVEKKKELKEIELAAAASQPSSFASSSKDGSTDSSKGQSDKEAYEEAKERKKLERQLTRKLEQAEVEIEALEKQIQQHEEQLCDPEVYQDHERVMAIQDELDEAKQKLEKTYADWEELEAALNQD
ncbi:ABC-F family ATP-binding cassette domain-containing protein [Bacillus horti]|uniref:ATP-binding cassette subfamily F protein 3 n=1 Tax=Caldalkalibacillus horti TaxID=77523 RepID=A0ABT9W5E5_9BACI|nr:ABC-F type ribosomal protection protein [Bacillus horti]MDQ0168289.1 ATP-binding cassette subfamily F protein 3 [Bacillus horti]